MTKTATILLSFVFFLSACTSSQLTTAGAVTAVESALGQTAAGQMAQQTINNMATKVGLTPAQTQQILPMLTQYYTSVENALKNNTGTKGVLKGFKDTFLGQAKTVLSSVQLGQVANML